MFSKTRCAQQAWCNTELVQAAQHLAIRSCKLHNTSQCARARSSAAPCKTRCAQQACCNTQSWCKLHNTSQFAHVQAAHTHTHTHTHSFGLSAAPCKTRFSNTQSSCKLHNTSQYAHVQAAQHLAMRAQTHLHTHTHTFTHTSAHILSDFQFVLAFDSAL